MPGATNRDQLQVEELSEFPLTGPFGGIQSELPLTEIEQLGFADCRNFLLRLGRAEIRPGYTSIPLPSPPANEPINAIADFYNANGQHIQCVITPTRLLQFVGGAWVQITGPAFGGTPDQLFAWDILQDKLCFSQGVDKIWMWDGISGSYVQSSTNAPPATIIAEVGSHLLAVNPASFQQYIWSGIGDPTDWTSFSSGSNNLRNNLGPLHAIIKLGQYGFGIYHQGIVQIIPTGNAQAPFYFIPIINASQGTIAPNSVDHLDDQGVEYAVYLGIDNVYTFNGSSVTPIGDMPLQGRKRVGARTRILADVKTVDPHTIYGFVSYSVVGNAFKAYWLVIPGVSVWVYNFDEGSWTVFTYSTLIKTIGAFFQNNQIRIADLVGRIQDQSWQPATVQSDNHFGGMLLGFNNGVGGYIDFTTLSEQPASVTSGKLIFGDRRHLHTVKKYRLSVIDNGPVPYTIMLTNEKNISETHTVTLGSTPGTGDVLNYVQEFKVTGLRITWKVSVPAQVPASIVEFCPLYDIGGEQRGGFINN